MKTIIIYIIIIILTGTKGCGFFKDNNDKKTDYIYKDTLIHNTNEIHINIKGDSTIIIIIKNGNN